MDERDRKLFLEALENLPKDLSRAKFDGAPARERPAAARPRSVHDTVLDLHGNTRETALARLRTALLRARGKGRRILVITGKGNNSEDGIGVLREAVVRFLETEGAAYIREYGVAAPGYGGDGAFDILTM